MKRPAFTLIEILIVISLLGIISLGLALSFQYGRSRAEFKKAEYQLTNIIQRARELSLSNILITDYAQDFETDYYQLQIREDGATLTAYGTSPAGELKPYEIEIINLNSDYGLSIDSALNIYYIPPYGEICFTINSANCDYSDGVTEKSFILSGQDSIQEKTFRLSIYSAYPEVE